MWYVGLDVHLDTTAISVRNRRGAVTQRHVVPTNRSAITRILKGIGGRMRIVCESGSAAAWIRNTLETRFREVVVCDRRRTRLTTSGAKTDRIDADKLSDLLYHDQLCIVHVPRGNAALLRRHALHYVRMQVERNRVLQRLRSLFYECGIRIAPSRSTRIRFPINRLTAPGAKFIARAYLRQLDVVTILVDDARATLIMLAQQQPAHALLQSVPYVGEVRAAELLAIVDDPHRFHSLRAFWSYSGLGVVQKLSSEHRIENGKAVRERQVRGLRLRAGQPLLKRVLRDIALHASLRRGPFRTIYEAHLARGKTPAVARIALARKIAAVILAVWRSGKPFSQNTIGET